MILLRPEFLLLIIPLAAYLAWRIKFQPKASSWQQLMEPALFDRLSSGHVNTGKYNAWIMPIVLLLSILALSGPALTKSQGNSATQGNLIVVLDNSLSMAGNDLKPDRITRAKRMIQDWADSGIFDKTSVIVYSASAHTLIPLTNDTETLNTQLQPLTPFIMPEFGNRAELAFTLLKDKMAATPSGPVHLLWLTDDIAAQKINAIKAAVPDFLSMSLVSVGTAAGSPIPLPNNQGYLQDNSGSMVVVKTNTTQMNNAAMTLGFTVAPLGAQPNKDYFSKLSLQASEVPGTHDIGYWFIFPAVLLLLLHLRHSSSLLLSSLLCIFLLTPEPAMALSLFKNSNQQAWLALQNDQLEKISRLTEDSWLNAEALFQQQDFEQAAELFSEIGNQESLYNLGNTLVHAGKYREALAAFESALALGEHHNATNNKELVEAFLENQPQQESGEQGDNQQQDQQQQSSDQQDSQQSNSEQHDESEQQDTPKDSEQSDRNSEEEQDSEAQQQEDENAENKDQILSPEELKQQQDIEAVLNQLESPAGSLLQQKLKYQYLQNPTDTDGTLW